MKKILIASKASYVVNELMQILLKNFQLTIYNLFILIDSKNIKNNNRLIFKNILDVKKDFKIN